MATVGENYLNLADYYRKLDGMGEVAEIIDMLTEINPILDDAIAQECNDGTSHQTVIRSGLPSGTWRKLYQGVQPGKSRTTQVKDTTGWLEAYSEVDKKLVDLAGKNGPSMRLDEAESFIEGMSNDMATSLFYEDSDTNPERFMGLAPRFNALSGYDAAGQVINNGGVGADNTSVWFVVWSPKTCSLLYPKGSSAGIRRQDLGEQTKENTDGSLYQVMREHFQWDVGMTVRDWRYISAVRNIDVSDIEAAGATALDTLIKNMIRAYYKLRQRRVRNGRAAIYCNTTIKTALHLAALEKASNTLTVTEFEGKEVVNFLGIPIRECDAILNTEALIS